tara:strand:+ start:1053 stop:1529 length:477 start_codon:yes stop_codon:yes gene_type:complete
MVIWIIGLSGSGKSFYAKEIKKKISNSIIVDGDEVRKYITTKLGYSSKDRKENSLMIIKLCSFLESKGLNVICPILSIFPQHQKKNRKIFKKYYQIYIEANKEDIVSRNKKKVYSLKKNVVGKDIKFPKPYESNLIIKNKFDQSYKKNIKRIISLIKK